MASSIASSGVSVIASPVSSQVATQGSSLEGLVGALSSFNSALAPTLQTIGKAQKANQEGAAHADALANGGQAYADAVRDGRIEPTQNPYYISQYEAQSGKVQGQGDMAKVLEDSASWEERNDPQAFNQRLSRTVGELAQTYKGAERQDGFWSAASPLLQQAGATNVAYNVTRIKEEHDQNISTLTTTSILDAVKANQGKAPDGAGVFAAMEPMHKSWLATGGTEPQWNNLVVNSVIAAAANSGDEITADKLLDSLSWDRNGQGALANQSGPKGNPVAEDIMQARYRIGQAIANQGFSSYRAKANQIKLQGANATSEIYASMGVEFIKGQVTRTQITDHLMGKGFPPEAIAEAMGNLAEDASKNQALGRALMGADVGVLDLYSKSRSEGYSDKLENDVSEFVRLGRMDINEGEQILGAAYSRLDSLRAEGRTASRQATSDARADARQGQTLKLQYGKDLKEHREQRVGATAQALPAVSKDPKIRADLSRTLTDAESNYLLTHPGDIDGAQKAVDDKANQWLLARRKPKTTAAAPGTSTNPRDKK